MATLEYGQLNATHTGLKVTIETEDGTATGTLLRVEHGGDVFHAGTFINPKLRIEMVKEVTVTVGSFGQHTFRTTQHIEIHNGEPPLDRR